MWARLRARNTTKFWTRSSLARYRLGGICLCFRWESHGWMLSLKAINVPKREKKYFNICLLSFLMAVAFFALIAFLLSVFSHPPWQADAPKTGLIPESDAVGVTVALITCTYRGQEFIRIGYYVNNEYTDHELRENPPLKPDYAQVTNAQTHCGDAVCGCSSR